MFLLNWIKNLGVNKEECKVCIQDTDMYQLEDRILFNASPWPFSPTETPSSTGDYSHTPHDTSAVHAPYGAFHTTNSVVIPNPYDRDLDIVLISDSLADNDGVRQAIPADAHVIVVDSHHDNLNTINYKLTELVNAEGKKIGSLAVLAHAEMGTIIMGTDRIDLANVQQFQPQLEETGKNFAEKAQIQLFGCSLAGDVYGQGLVEVISVATHTDVYASTNATGYGPEKDWTLEYTTNPGSEMHTVVDTEQMAALPVDLVAGDVVITKGTIGPINEVPVATPVNLNGAFSVTNLAGTVSSHITNVTLLAHPAGWALISVDTNVTFLNGVGLGPGNVNVAVPGRIVITDATAVQASAVLGTLYGTLNAGFTGNAQILIYAQDASTLDGADDTLTVTVNPVPPINPVVAVPLPVTVTANTTTPITGISISDADIGTGQLTVTLFAKHGTLTVQVPATTPGSTPTTYTNANITFTDTLAHVNTALEGLKYTPTSGYAGTDANAISITAVDQNLGTDTETVAITVNPIAAVAGPDIIFTTPVPADQNATTLIPDLSVNDPVIGTGKITVTLSVEHGTLSALIREVTITEVPNTIPAQTRTDYTIVETTGARISFTDELQWARASLAGIMYTPTTGYTGVDHLTITAVDQTNLPDTETVVINVAPIVYPGPTVTVPGAQTVSENASLSITGIHVAESGYTGALTVTLSVLHGKLTVQVPATPPGTTPTTYTSAIVTFTDTLANVNAALAGLIYTPTEKYDNGDLLSVTAVDQSVPNPLSNTNWVGITATNVDPTIAAPAGVNVTNSVVAAITGISVADPDIATTNMTVTLSVSYGVLHVPSSTNVTGNGTSTVIINDTLANVNTQLSGLQYYTSLTTPDVLTITANDQSTPTAGTDSETVNITVTVLPDPVLSAPVVTVPVAQTVSENSSLAIPGISVYDADIGTGQLTVTLRVLHGTVTVQVPATTPGTTPTTQTGPIITFTDTLTNVNTALAGLIYTPTEKYDNGDLLSVTAVDQSVPNPLSNTNWVGITATNVDPTITAPATATAVTATATAITGISLADPDIALTNMSVTLSVSYGVVNLPSSTNVTGNGTSTVIINDTLPNVNTQLAGLQYISNAGYTGLDTLSITANDLSTPTAGTDAEQVQITVSKYAPVPSPSPAVINAPSVLSVNEDTAVTVQFTPTTPVSVEYADSTTELRVTLTANNGYLTLGWKGQLTSYTGDGTTKVNFTGPLNAINNALYGLKYAPVHNYFDTTDDTLTIRVNDQAGQVTTKSVALNVYSVNDPPVISVPGTQDVGLNNARLISGVSVADPDILAGTMDMTLGVLHGTVAVTGVAAAPNIVFTNTLANVNTMLGTLTYTPVPNYQGPDWLTFTANDRGNSGAGGAMSDTKTVPLRIGNYWVL